MEAGGLREGVVAGGRRKKEGSSKKTGVLQDHIASEHEQNILWLRFSPIRVCNAKGRIVVGFA